MEKVKKILGREKALGILQFDQREPFAITGIFTKQGISYLDAKTVYQ